MNKFVISVFLGMLCYPLFAQKATKDANSQEYANTITQKDLSKHLHIIASDEMEGRRTGTKGQKKAAEYISNHFKIYLNAELKYDQHHFLADMKLRHKC